MSLTILDNLGFIFWYVLGEPVLAIAGLFLIYSIILSIYYLIIKR